jgi:hypothetical protein
VNNTGSSYSIEEGKQGIESLKSWVKQILQNLIQDEKLHCPCRLSLKDICLVDVSFIQDENSQYHYFVNGVKHGYNVMFFSTMLDTERANNVWAKLATLVYSRGYSHSRNF